MKTAEEWLQEAYQEHPQLLDIREIREKSIKFYRQIQADAMRHAASQLQNNWLVKDLILNQANQLDPKL